MVGRITILTLRPMIIASRSVVPIAVSKPNDEGCMLELVLLKQHGIIEPSTKA